VARQQKQVEKFKTLDLPGLEVRRERIQAALAAAAADLEAGLPYDVLASQEWVKRELEGLKFALVDRSDDPADAVRGGESDLQRIQRLSWSRRLAVKDAEKLRGSRNPPASEKARLELAREFEDLMATRAGAAGQSLKHRATEQYHNLKNASEPDHDAASQKALADTLDELAGMMADSGELTRTFDRIGRAPAATAADRYLPSHSLAAELRALALEYTRVRDRLNRLAEYVNKRTQAGGTDPYSERQKRHDFRSKEMIVQAVDLADTLFLAAASRHPEDGVRVVLTDASQAAKTAARLLADALQKTASGDRAGAETARKNAHVLLTEHGSRIAKSAPTITAPTDPKMVPPAESLLRATSAMRRAEELLGAKPDFRAAEATMRSAADAMDEAIARRMRVGE
jgi:hypothetical protein